MYVRHLPNDVWAKMSDDECKAWIDETCKISGKSTDYIKDLMVREGAKWQDARRYVFNSVNLERIY